MKDRIEQMVWDRIHSELDQEQFGTDGGRMEAIEEGMLEELARAREAETAAMQAQAEAAAAQEQEPQQETFTEEELELANRIDSSSVDELNEMKHWLFRENIRLRGERLELEDLKEELEDERRRQEADQKMYLNHIAQEREEVRKEEELVAEKLEIIKRGFAELDADRRALKEQKERLDSREAVLESKLKYSYTADSPEVEDVLFLGVTSYLALKK
ncbi:MAG: hypothetical protein IKS87_01055, partial [Lachnospiraceae bacterium]|nr:hypothetical protein [Lachnospiraceae bacterium]